MVLYPCSCGCSRGCCYEAPSVMLALKKNLFSYQKIELTLFGGKPFVIDFFKLWIRFSYQLIFCNEFFEHSITQI